MEMECDTSAWDSRGILLKRSAWVIPWLVSILHSCALSSFAAEGGNGEMLLLRPQPGATASYAVHVVSTRDCIIEGKGNPVEMEYDCDLALSIGPGEKQGEDKVFLGCKNAVVQIRRLKVSAPAAGPPLPKEGGKLELGDIRIIASRSGEIEKVSVSANTHPLLKESLTRLVLPALVLPRGRRIDDGDAKPTYRVGPGPVEVRVWPPPARNRFQGGKSVSLGDPTHDYFQMIYQLPVISGKDYEIAGAEETVPTRLCPYDIKKRLWALCDRESGLVKKLLFDFRWDVAYDVEEVRRNVKRHERLVVNLDRDAAFPKTAQGVFEGLLSDAETTDFWGQPEKTVKQGKVTVNRETVSLNPNPTSPKERSHEPPVAHFNSKLPFDVFVVLAEGTAPRRVGSTPAPEPVAIPPCLRWWVAPVGKPDMAAVRREAQGLKIPGLRFDFASDADLLELQDLPALRTLYLSGAHVTDAGMAHLKGLTKLQWLRLPPRVTDAGLAHLKGLTQLQGLDLGGTRITDAGLAYLEELAQLRSLSLFFTRVTDAGLVHLKNLTRLEWLELRRTQITDGGLVHLRELKQLQKLDLSGTRVTEAGAAALRGALPGISILR